MHLRRLARWPGGLTLAAVLAAAGPARGDETPVADQARADALFQDAMKLMAEHRAAEACPELERSEALDPAIGTQYRLGECYEAVGHLGAAWTKFRAVVELARTTGQAERERVASERAAALEPRLSHLTVVVTEPDTPGLEVRRDAAVLDRKDYGATLLVDRAEYVIIASAPGRWRWKKAVQIGEAQAVTVTVPALDPTAEPDPAAAAAHPSVSPWKTVAFATADVGLVGVVVGAIFGGLAVSGNDAAESSGCSGARCSPSAAATRNQAQSMADVSTASLAIGGVLLAGGITLWWLAPEAAQPRPAVGLSAGPASLMLRGSW